MKNRLVTVTFECATSDEEHALFIIESSFQESTMLRNQMIVGYTIDRTTEET